MEIKELNPTKKKLEQEMPVPFSNDDFIYDFKKESKPNLVDKFEIVKDYVSKTKVRENVKTNYGASIEWVEERRGQHELLAEAMGKLINKIKEGKYDNLVFLDKSGRPLVTMLRDMWPYRYDSDGKMIDKKQHRDPLPDINFLNIGRETQYFLQDYLRDNFDIIYDIVKHEYEKDPDTFRKKHHDDDDYQLCRVFEWMEKVKNEKVKFPSHLPRETYSRLTLSIMKAPEVNRKIEKLTEFHSLFKKEGRTLIIDECSITGNSEEIAKRVIETGLEIKNQKGQVDMYDLINDHDNYSSLFKDIDGFGRIPPWRNPDDLEGITGVVDSPDNEFIAQAFHKENPNIGKEVRQLRNELHTIAYNYLQEQKKNIEDRKIKEIQDTIWQNN